MKEWGDEKDGGRWGTGGGHEKRETGHGDGARPVCTGRDNMKSRDRCPIVVL
jgi:hypothetical protein